MEILLSLRDFLVVDMNKEYKAPDITEIEFSASDSVLEASPFNGASNDAYDYEEFNWS